MLSPDLGILGRRQAENPLILLFRFPEPPLRPPTQFPEDPELRMAARGSMAELLNTPIIQLSVRASMLRFVVAMGFLPRAIASPAIPILGDIRLDARLPRRRRASF